MSTSMNGDPMDSSHTGGKAGASLVRIFGAACVLPLALSSSPSPSPPAPSGPGFGLCIGCARALGLPLAFDAVLKSALALGFATICAVGFGAGRRKDVALRMDGGEVAGGLSWSGG